MRHYFKLQGEIRVLFLLCIFIVGCSAPSTETTESPTNTLPPLTAIVAHPIASTGCGQKSAVPPGHNQVQTFFSGRIRRSYLLHIPRSYRDTIQQPLVLNFHGHGDNAEQQALYSNFSVLADRQDFVVAYPQGVVGPDKQTGWATGPARNPHVNDLLFVSDMLNKLQSSFCINPSRIYATGFSNGGGMTDVLACKMADRIAAFAPVSGSYPAVPGGCYPARPVPILEFHGTGDQVVPYDGSRAKSYPPIQQWLAGWVALDGCTAPPVMTRVLPTVTEEQWQGCRGDATLIHYQIAHWPHAWPHFTSVRHNSSQHPIATDSFNATPIIWTFFLAHPL